MTLGEPIGLEAGMLPSVKRGARAPKKPPPVMTMVLDTQCGKDVAQSEPPFHFFLGDGIRALTAQGCPTLTSMSAPNVPSEPETASVHSWDARSSRWRTQGTQAAACPGARAAGCCSLF